MGIPFNKATPEPVRKSHGNVEFCYHGNGVQLSLNGIVYPCFSARCHNGHVGDRLSGLTSKKIVFCKSLMSNTYFSFASLYFTFTNPNHQRYERLTKPAFNCPMAEHVRGMGLFLQWRQELIYVAKVLSKV